jgi:hypothetical protein
MSKSLSPLQADILAVLAAADGPISTTDVRNELNAHVGRRAVAEQVYKGCATGPPYVMDNGDYS